MINVLLIYHNVFILEIKLEFLFKCSDCYCFESSKKMLFLHRNLWTDLRLIATT